MGRNLATRLHLTCVRRTPLRPAMWLTGLVLMLAVRAPGGTIPHSTAQEPTTAGQSLGRIAAARVWRDRFDGSSLSAGSMVISSRCQSREQRRWGGATRR